VDEAVVHGCGLGARDLQPMQDRVRLDAFDASDASQTIAFGQHANGFQDIAARGSQMIEETRSRLTEGLAANDAVITAFFVTVDLNSTSLMFIKSRARTIGTTLLIGFHHAPFS
jgi:hypothetical protein